MRNGIPALGQSTRTVVLTIPPPSQLPEIEQSNPSVRSPHYMELVARELPQGSPPSETAVLRNSALPVVLSEALSCKVLEICILESHARGWVGINTMALFE